MTDDAVLVDERDGIATVTIDRPDVRNALTREVLAGLSTALDEIERRNARCVLLCGADGTFSAGGDIGAMVEARESATPLHERGRRLVREMGRTIRRVHEFPVPTVAGIEGVAVGAGATLALACDVQLASSDARMSFGFSRVGLNVDAGTSYLLPRYVGENVAKELAFTGELVGADRAARLGLVNHTYPASEFETEVDAFVEALADGPTIALRASKRLIGRGLDSTLDQAVANEAAAQSAILETSDHEEGIRAFEERRRPEFEGR